MKTSLSWSVSRQNAAHRLFRFPRSTVDTFDAYFDTIQSLRRSLKIKRQKLLTEGVVLLHDNALSHVSRVTNMKLTKFNLVLIDHPP